MYTEIQQAAQAALYGIGLIGIPVVNVSNNCSTGSSALFMARQAVATGLVDCALGAHEGHELRPRRAGAGHGPVDTRQPGRQRRLADRHHDVVPGAEVRVHTRPGKPGLLGEGGEAHPLPPAGDQQPAGRLDQGLALLRAVLRHGGGADQPRPRR